MKNINITYYSRFIAKDWGKEANVATRRPRRGGFTLVEMLVVVIIIGILASIALPAYQKSVEQSRAAQIWPLMKSISNAAQMYYMSRGTYPTTFDSLSILPPSWSGTEQWCTMQSMKDTRSDGEWSLQIGADPSVGLVIYAGRLKGKYRGAGFLMTVTKSTLADDMTLMCGERLASGITFEEPAGSYCQEIFDGTLLHDLAYMRMYQMP